MEGAAQKIWQIIQDHQNFIIPLHISPDPDSVGSALALREVLIGMGKSVRVTSEDKRGPESMINFITDAPTSIEFETPLTFSEPVVVIFADGSDSYRFSSTLKTEELNNPTVLSVINIDHHPTGDIGEYLKGGSRGAVYINESYTANTEVLLELFTEWGCDINVLTAKLLLYGIHGDTEELQNASVNTLTFKNIARLSELGANWHDFILNISWNVSVETMMLLKEYLSRLNVDQEYGFAWVVMPLWILDQFPEEKVNFDFIKHRCLRVISGMKFAVDIKEKGPDKITLSFRARTNEVDMSVLASRVSPTAGGGHPGAGGALLKNMTLVEAEEILVTEARKYITELGLHL